MGDFHKENEENLQEGSNFDLGSLIHANSDDEDSSYTKEEERQYIANSREAKKNAKEKAKIQEEESKKKHSEPKVQGEKEIKGDVSTSQKRNQPKETGKTSPRNNISTKKMQGSVPHNTIGGDGGKDPPEHSKKVLNLHEVDTVQAEDNEEQEKGKETELQTLAQSHQHT
eukprot:Gb_37387 [translate_table: standard]